MVRYNSYGITVEVVISIVEECQLHFSVIVIFPPQRANHISANTRLPATTLASLCT